MGPVFYLVITVQLVKACKDLWLDARIGGGPVRAVELFKDLSSVLQAKIVRGIFPKLPPQYWNVLTLHSTCLKLSSVS